MVGFVRFVVVWLLALALPAQGLAAATMVHCAATHERMHAAATHAPAHAADHQHHHRHHHDHEHGVGAASPGDLHASPAADKAGAGADSFPDLGQYKCGACGSCCSAAAMPGFALIVPAPPAVAQWEAVGFHGRIVFVTDGPERPPRPFLA